MGVSVVGVRVGARGRFLLKWVHVGEGDRELLCLWEVRVGVFMGVTLWECACRSLRVCMGGMR